MANIAAPADKPLHELLTRSMVDLYVGPENTHWILHEKLLCHHSAFFRKIFYNRDSKSTPFGLPDDENAPFKTFVGWLYSSALPIPREEKDLGNLFDLYLMAEKWQIPHLMTDVLQTVREWYKYSDTYPGLRRVQYMYANTEDGSPMRSMLVHSIARQMVLEDGIPKHWDKALRKNGQLAVDIIKAIQDWRLDEELIPDAREEPVEPIEEEDLNSMGDETVVESEGKDSPLQVKNADSQKPSQKSVDHKVLDKEGDVSMSELPIGISVGDYGSNH